MNKYYLLILTLFALVASKATETLESILQKGHSKYITAYDFSSDNKFVVTGSHDNSIILWSLESGREIRMFNRHTDPIHSVKFSNDNKKILTSAADNTAKVFDVMTGNQLLSVRISKNELTESFFSPDNAYIVLLDNRDGVYVFDATSGKLINQFVKDYGAFNLIGLIDNTNTKILSDGNYEKFYVRNIKTGDTLLTIPFDKAYQLSFSPNGKFIAASSAKLFTKIFDANTGKEIYELKYGDEQCDGCNTKHVFSNSGNFIVTMSNKVDAILWDLTSGKKIKSFTEIRERPKQILFSDDDSYVLISFDEDVYVFEIKSGKEKLHVNSKNISYFTFHFSQDGQYILLPGANNEGLIYQVDNGKKKKSLEGFLNKKRDDGLRFSDENWTDKRILKYISMRRNFALSPDAKSIVIGNIDSTALVLSLETGKIIHELKGHRKVVFALAYSPDGTTIATAGGDRTIKLWNSVTGEEITSLKGHQELIFDIKFSSDGKKLASGSWDGSMRIWDLENLGEFHRIDMGNVSPYTVGFTPNNLYAVTGDLEKHVDFWEIDAGKSFRTLIGHTSILSSFDFSANGQYIVTASWDGRVKVWDVLTGMLLSKMEKHEGQVCAVRFDPKMRYVASGGSDNTIILWNPEKQNIVGELKGHSSTITSLSFTRNGDRLISCSIDGMIKIWDLTTLKEVYSRIQINRIDWLATNPNGLFDGSAKALDLVNYVSGMDVIPVGSLFDKYYTPGLIQKITNGEKLNDSGENLNQLIKTSPIISFEFKNSNYRSVTTDSIYEWRQSVLPISLRINSQGENIDEIRVYNNGKLIIQESLSGELVFRGGDKDLKSFDIPLSNGTNNISAVVVNSDRTESVPSKINVNYDGTAALTDLFIITIGINQYKNPQYNLSYAVNDAQAFSTAIVKGSGSLFNSVKEIQILNDQATKINITSKIQEIKSLIGPEDVFVFYYAGHGVMSFAKADEAADFFIVTHDVTNLYDETSVLKSKALSATELMNFSREISAEKQLFILDACHSGGALEAFASRGDGREKALAQLARSTGTFFLTASQDAQFANEVGDLKHGLFTYALLEILNGQLGDNGDQKITISELKSYVEERVPELSSQYRGSPQYPTSYSFGQDFPIVIIK